MVWVVWAVQMTRHAGVDIGATGGGASARREAWRTICPRFEDDLAQSVDDADSEVREVRPSDARDHRLLGHPG